MRYLLYLGLIITALFIFSSPSQAADQLEVCNYKIAHTKADIVPIEPIKPIEPKASKRKFWQNKFKLKQQQNEVEPIASYWYTIMLVLTILAIPSFLGLGLFVILAVSYAAVSEILALAILVFVLIGITLAILYAIKLQEAAKGVEKHMKGWRFILGYITGGLFLFASGMGLFIVVFNIIDHLRYRQYLKSLDNNPQ